MAMIMRAITEKIKANPLKANENFFIKSSLLHRRTIVELSTPITELWFSKLSTGGVDVGIVGNDPTCWFDAWSLLVIDMFFVF